MSGQKGMIRSTIYLPRDLHKKAKEAGINNSAISRRAIEHELYGDNPKFIEDKLRDALRDKQHGEREIEQLKEDLQKAIHKRKECKERLQQSKPSEVRDYRTIIPKEDDK
jgi:peptidoglycan hydrolase CwlO-like protein